MQLRIILTKLRVETLGKLLLNTSSVSWGVLTREGTCRGRGSSVRCARRRWFLLALTGWAEYHHGFSVRVWIVVKANWKRVNCREWELPRKVANTNQKQNIRNILNASYTHTQRERTKLVNPANIGKIQCIFGHWCASQCDGAHLEYHKHSPCWSGGAEVVFTERQPCGGGGGPPGPGICAYFRNLGFHAVEALFWFVRPGWHIERSR